MKQRRKFWLVTAAWTVWVCAAPLAAQEAKPDEPVFDPLRAEKNVEVGRYYLKKGNYYAAIERFKEALLYKPNYALPHKLLGEAYEKSQQPQDAITHYEKYLEILPGAEDAGKIRERIAKLKQEIEKQKRKRPRT
jgi:tetratricopeptide (TPR) repeat protein